MLRLLGTGCNPGTYRKPHAHFQADAASTTSLSLAPCKHSFSSDDTQDEVTSPQRNKAPAIHVQSAPALPWHEVLALGYIRKHWKPPHMPRREQVVESQRSRLHLLHHAFHCTASEENCPLGAGCVACKHLWQHMLTCSDTDCDPR